jgi:hypothetical protein
MPAKKKISEKKTKDTKKKRERLKKVVELLYPPSKSTTLIAAGLSGLKLKLSVKQSVLVNSDTPSKPPRNEAIPSLPARTPLPEL